MTLKDRVALITGAGSGIGRAIAFSLAYRGCHLALVDISVQSLTQTVEQIKALGVTVTGYTLDVVDRQAVSVLPNQVLTDHGRVDLLINNAGIAAGGTFERIREQDFDRVIEVNFHAVVRLTRAFLPYLHQSDEGRLVYLSSLNGLVSPPEQSAYSASKFAVRGFSNALRHELKGTRVGVTVIHPGGVDTAISKAALVPPDATQEETNKRLALHARLLRMPPEQAAEVIVRGIENGKARILVGMDAHIVSWLERLLPVSYWPVLRALRKLR